MKQNVPRLCTGLGVLRVVVRTTIRHLAEWSNALGLGPSSHPFKSDSGDYQSLMKNKNQKYKVGDRIFVTYSTASEYAKIKGLVVETV